MHHEAANLVVLPCLQCQGPGVVPKNGTSDLFFCQSSQPKWSAHRDPSFGHGVMDIMSPEVRGRVS